MKALLTIIPLFFALQSLSQIKIKTHSVRTINGKEIEKDSLSVLKKDYFEISLMSMARGSYFTAQKTIEAAEPGKPFKMVIAMIVDDANAPKKFKEASDLLNFMSAGGYEMVGQTKEKYRTDYTFKKKR